MTGRNLISKVALIWPIYSFYHLVRARSLSQLIGTENLLCIELFGETSEPRTKPFRCLQRDELQLITLFPDKWEGGVSGVVIGKRLIEELEARGIGVIFVNGYGSRENRMVIDWAHRTRRKCFTFFESKRDDTKRYFWVECVKRRIVRKLEGAICGGRSHQEYAIELGARPERTLTGYDVVDNHFFKEHAGHARSDETNLRKSYRLPEKYFLSCARFVEKKNIAGLLEAFKRYRKDCGGKPWDLVLCGDGPLRDKLERKVNREQMTGVHFAGFQPAERLAVYYGLAKCFVLASQVEQWGLVVNEAMACGLPVLVSRAAGAVHELVRDKENGFTFNPSDISQLSRLMVEMAGGKYDLPAMGRRSSELIAPWNPELFARGIVELIKRAASKD